MSQHEHLLSPDGQPSAETVHRYESGELRGAELVFVEDRLEELRAGAQPSAAGAAAGPWWRSWRGSVGVLAGGAAVLLVLHPGEPRVDHDWIAEGPREVEAQEPVSEVPTQGSDFDLRVQIQDGATTHWAGRGQTAHPGDEMRFIVYPRVAGYLMIVGLDAEGEVYRCHPRETSQSEEIAASPKSVALEGSMGLDGVLGQERIIGLLCDAPFEYAEIAKSLAEVGDEVPHLRPGCEQMVIVLDKTEREDAEAPGLDENGDPDAPGGVVEEEIEPGEGTGDEDGLAEVIPQ